MIQQEKDKAGGALMVVFNTGFLIALVGALVYLLSMWDRVMTPLFNLLDLWAIINSMPLWMQIAAAGLVLSFSAIVVGTLKELTTSMINELFKGREDF